VNFSELNLNPQLLRAIGELGFETPMPVQQEIIPRFLETESDLVGLAQTGTGKTAAFGLPILQLISPESRHAQALILAPTRELCVQIASDLRDYSKYSTGIKITPIYGGAGFQGQLKELAAGPQVIVATPGRMLDMIKRGNIKLNNIRFLVLDEADEMLNMGFEEDVSAIISHTPASRRTFLFSATMPYEVEQIALQYMKSPETVTIGQRGKGASTVKHIYYIAHARDRYQVLKRIADYYPNIYGIVFCRTRQETQEIADSLIRDGYSAEALHGDLSQSQRDYVMNKFRIRHLKMLVATDVAARGLDVEELSHVINYNLPDELEVYVHRSGRTGRAGRTGISISIINLKEKHKIRQLEKQVGKEFSQAKIPLGHQICEKQLYYLIDKMENVEVNEEDVEAFLPVIYKKLKWMSQEELIKRFVSVEFNRFLDYYRDAGDLNVDENRETASSAKYTRVFMSIGRKDGLIPPRLIGVINDFTTTRDLRIGKIEIEDNFSFVEIDSRFIDRFMQAFKGKYYNNRPVRVDIAEEKRFKNKPSGKRKVEINTKPSTETDKTYKKEGKKKWKSSSDPYFGDRNPKEGKQKRRF
jgi:ATP-dependent RNA helicase DeaD